MVRSSGLLWISWLGPVRPVHAQLVNADESWMSVQVPADLYRETVIWLGQRMAEREPAGLEVQAPPFEDVAACRLDDVMQYRELLQKSHRATERVRLFVSAALVDPPRWWAAEELRLTCDISPSEFRATWRALTQHMARFYPDLAQPFERLSGHALGRGEGTLYRLRPHLVETLRAAVPKGKEVE